MANVRCKEKHSRPLIERTQGKYVARIEPLNYPNTSVICRREGCTEPGLVHLVEKEWLAYQQKERIFGLFRSGGVKIRVDKNAEIIERQNGEILFRQVGLPMSMK